MATTTAETSHPATAAAAAAAAVPYLVTTKSLTAENVDGPGDLLAVARRAISVGRLNILTDGYAHNQDGGFYTASHAEAWLYDVDTAIAGYSREGDIVIVSMSKGIEDKGTVSASMSIAAARRLRDELDVAIGDAALRRPRP